MFPDRNDFRTKMNSFEKQHRQIFRFVFAAWIIGGVASLSLIAAIIYVLVKFAGTL